MKDIFSNTIHILGSMGISLLLGSTIACSPKGGSEVDNKGADANGGTPDNISITEQQFTAGDMALGRITLQEFSTVVTANGMFSVPPQNKADVSAYFAGYVKDIHLLPGETVKKGQVLFTMENPDYVQVQRDFLEASGRLDYLRSDYERQKALMADNVTSQKNFLKAESEYKVTLAQYQSLKKELDLMNIDPKTLSGDNIRSMISVRSPLSGYATAVNIGKGMFLNPSDIAVTVTNTDDLHIELKIFEKDLPAVKIGQPINIRLQNNTDNVYKGEVHLVNRAIDERERTVMIHGDLLNREDVKLFAPGMYIEGEILTTTSQHPALPSDAVVNIDNDFFALVKENDSTFKKVLIKAGTTNRGFTQILNSNDFGQDAQFLTKGAFNLLTE